MIDIKATKTHFLEVGNPQDPSVLFLHGSSFKAETWQEIGTLEFIFQNQYHGIAVDLPGYGKSASFSGNRVEFLQRPRTKPTHFSRGM
ncbi:alpha/beta fold hydrolase [Planktothrix sp.]|uniref:alpha/beta fold hydrolase n=1 Tax=Planktothrix sp. TaxID=3088171 RepID=UPI0038D35C3C